MPCDYGQFLCATIGEDENETPLTVLTVLTRLDMDPWQEAARLRELPKNEAIRDIGSVLGKLPCNRSTAAESSQVAARLVELLPPPNDAALSLAEARIGRRVALVLTLMWIIFASVWMGFVVWTSNPNHPDLHAANAFSGHLPLVQSQ